MTSSQPNPSKNTNNPSHNDAAKSERAEPRPDIAEAKIVAQNHHYKTPEQKGRWHKILSFFGRHSLAVFAVIASGAAAVYTYKQADIAEKALVIGQRAFVYLDRIEAKWVDTKTAIPGKVINVTFFIGNSGNTPTRDLRMVAGCYSLGPELPREPFSAFKWDEKRIAHLVIAPHQVLAYPACKLTEREIDPLQSSPFIQRYFMGEILYFDIVSKPAEERVTQFVQELAIHDFDSKIERLNYETLLAGLHNCSDDECKNAKGDPGALAAPRWVVR
jgi:hypothetical protein